jgi:DNA-binding transcriptional MerR regulator
MFSVSETALLLGISKSYLSTLEREHAMYARRNQRGKRVYSAKDIAILRAMGVGSRPRRLRFSFSTYDSFGRELPEGSVGAWEKSLEREELERLRSIREGQKQRWAKEWEEHSQEPPQAAQTAEEASEVAEEPRPATGEAQEGAQRPWWRRIFGG